MKETLGGCVWRIRIYRLPGAQYRDIGLCSRAEWIRNGVPELVAPLTPAVDEESDGSIAVDGHLGAPAAIPLIHGHDLESIAVRVEIVGQHVDGHGFAVGGGRGPVGPGHRCPVRKDDINNDGSRCATAATIADCKTEVVAADEFVVRLIPQYIARLRDRAVFGLVERSDAQFVAVVLAEASDPDDIHGPAAKRLGAQVADDRRLVAPLHRDGDGGTGLAAAAVVDREGECVAADELFARLIAQHTA